MTTARHVLVVSGSRADYSLLYWPMRLLAADPAFRLSIAATGMHLSHAHGHTLDQFERDGFSVAARIPTLVDDSDVEVARAIGRGVIGFVDVLQNLKPDLMLVLGDRFEILAAAEAAFVQHIPIAHLCGGDVTNGALDDGFRHAITKMASLHFVTTEDAARRVRQLGEMPSRVFNVGSSGIDFILRGERLGRAELERQLGHALPGRFLLVTFHPVTLDPVPSLDQVAALIGALADLPSDMGIIFTYANADAGGAGINDMIAAFAQKRPQTFAHPSLGPLRFHSLMALAAAVVGNSSSGLYEAPSFSVPTVNIGRRQDGRPRASSVIDCPPERTAIAAAINRALGHHCHGVVNPYGDGRTSERIVAILRDTADWPSLIYKSFHDLPDA